MPHLFGSGRKHWASHDGNTFCRDSIAGRDRHSNYSIARNTTPDANRPLRTSSLYALTSGLSGVSMSSMVGGGSTRSVPRRPRSPVSLYVPADLGAPKQPRPLVKLEKKAKSFQNQSSSSLVSLSPTSSLSGHSQSRSSVLIGPLWKRVSVRRKDSSVGLEEPYPLSPPDTPTFISSQQKRLRRLDKLTRTLGEGIPAELVLGTLSSPSPSPVSPTFPSCPTQLSRSKSMDNRRYIPEPSKNTTYSKRRESVSPMTPDLRSDLSSAAHSRDVSTTSHAFSHHHSSSTGSQSSFVLPDLVSRESQAEHSPSTSVEGVCTLDIDCVSRRKSTSSELETIVFQSSTGPSDELDEPSPISFGPPSPAFEPREKWDDILVTEVDEPTITISPPPRRKGHTTSSSVSDAILPPRSDTPFLHSTMTTDSDAFLEVNDGTRKAARKERRQGWSGEWNRDDMQDVISKLRMLR